MFRLAPFLRIFIARSFEDIRSLFQHHSNIRIHWEYMNAFLAKLIPEEGSENLACDTSKADD